MVEKKFIYQRLNPNRDGFGTSMFYEVSPYHERYL